MSYLSRLEDLIELNRAGAIEPADAYSAVEEMKQARHDRRLAKRQAAAEAQQGLLEALTQVATSSASEGMTMGETRPLLESLVAGAGLPAMGGFGKLPSIDPLFNRGISTVNPDIDPEDEAGIASDVFRFYGDSEAPDLFTIRQKVAAQAQQRYGSDYDILSPAIDAVIEEAYKRAATGA